MALPVLLFAPVSRFSFSGKSLVKSQDIEYNGSNYSIHYSIQEYLLMNKNKKIILCVVAFLLVALIATGVLLKVMHDRKMEALRIYNANTVSTEPSEAGIKRPACPIKQNKHTVFRETVLPPVLGRSEEHTSELQSRE